MPTVFEKSWNSMSPVVASRSVDHDEVTCFHLDLQSALSIEAADVCARDPHAMLEGHMVPHPALTQSYRSALEELVAEAGSVEPVVKVVNTL